MISVYSLCALISYFETSIAREERVIVFCDGRGRVEICVCCLYYIFCAKNKIRTMEKHCHNAERYKKYRNEKG